MRRLNYKSNGQETIPLKCSFHQVAIKLSFCINFCIYFSVTASKRFKIHSKYYGQIRCLVHFALKCCDRAEWPALAIDVDFSVNI